jgi:membrane associated rhomboid family serine protease
MNRAKAIFTPERVLVLLGIGVIITVVAIAVGGRYTGALGAILACLIGGLLSVYWRRGTNHK